MDDEKLNEELGKKANAADITNLTADKVSKTDELHVKKGTYDVSDTGPVTLKKVNGNGTGAGTEDVIIQGLARKADITAINTELAKKVSNDAFTAEKNRVNTELGKKLDTATFEAEKATLATHDDINALKEVVAGKLDKDTAEKFIKGMENKVSTADLNKKLEDAATANTTALNAVKEELNNAINTATADKVSKADELHVAPDTYEVDQTADTVTLRQENGLNEPKADKNFTITGIATKKDVTELTTKIGEKADAADVTAKLAEKANAADVTEKLAKKADQDAFNELAEKVNGKADAAALTTMGTNKLDKTAELHVKTGNPYTVDADGNVTLKQENGEGTEAASKDIVIEGVASKANLDAITTRVGDAEGKITGLEADVAGHTGKLDALTNRVTDVEALANDTKDKVGALTTKVGTLNDKLAEHDTKLEEAKNAIDGINQNITNNYVSNDALKEKVKDLKNDLDAKTVLHFAGDTTINDGGTPDDTTDDDNTASKLSLNLKDQTLKVKGATNEITTTAKGDTITVGLSDKVKEDLAKTAKLGDTTADGRDGASGTAKDTGLTGQDGLNGKTLTDKVNALRNGEAGSVVYTNADGERLAKANDGKYYLAKDVDADGNKVGAAKAVEGDALKASVVNPDGTNNPTTLSNLKDGKIVSGSKDAVTGNQLHAAKAEVAKYLGGNATVDENGNVTKPTFTVKDKDGKDVDAHNVGDALSTMNDRLNNSTSAAAADIKQLKDMEGLSDKGKTAIKDIAKDAINVIGDGKAINVFDVSDEVPDSDKKIFKVTLSSHLELAKPTRDEQGNVIETPNDVDNKGNPIFNKEKANMGLDINGNDGSITAGYGDSVVNIDGRHGAITAGAGAHEVKLNGADGSVTANTGVFGDRSGANGSPANGKSKVTINDKGLSIVSMDDKGNPSTITFKDGTITGLKAGTGDNDVATVGQMKEALANTSGQIGEAVKETAKRVNEVGAHSAALAALNPLSYDPLRKSQIMAGVGTYSGNQALALGLAHYANENLMVTAGFTMGSGKSMANLGATYRFGSGEHDDLPERYKGGPISSVYVMQDEIAELKAENARKDAENAEMKAQIKILMERMGLA